ncbi:DUF1963 domain-containing protein [Nonomuraea dietziae]|uniref:DUF1963 domain-containing protein n=1 Tax=Nonomuraea dietziae TaxID=65515 RepID=UPI00344A6752
MSRVPCLQIPLRRREEFIHVLQLSSTEEFQWGDGGALHFLSPATALREGDFSHVVADASD